MQLVEALYAGMCANGPIAGLVTTRIYNKVAPQKPTYPLIVMHRIATGRENSNDGPLDLADAVMQFNCLSKTSSQARQVAAAVRLFIDGYVGSMGGASGVEVNGAFVDDERDDYDDELEVHAVQLDVGIMYNE